MFGMASIWKMYSLPERRAGSPVHISDGPRMAKSMPARCMQLGHGLADLLVLVVERAGAADPVEVLVARTASPRSTISMPSSSAAQSPRSPWLMPHGLPWFSIDR